MAVYLTNLVPKTGLASWYPLDNDTAGDAIDDESGNARHLGAEAPGIDFGAITADQINGRNAVVHVENVSPFRYTGSITAKDIFVIGKVDYASVFPATYGGMLSGLAAGNLPALVGSPATARWLTNAEGAPAYDYYKSGTSYVNTNRLAPYSYFEQMRLSITAGMVLDGIQFGRDRDFATRLFTGKWCDAMFYTSVLAAADVTKLKLYGDLKFGLWLLNGTTLTFPDPSISGINYRHFYAAPKRWDDIVTSHEYEDRGRSFNRAASTPPREWVVEMDCLGALHAEAKAQYDIFDAFWDAAGIDRAFSFTDKYGEVHTNVRIKEYSRTHTAHKSWQNAAAFRLIKYP